MKKIFLFFVIFLATTFCYAQTYYISPIGNNAAAGTSIAPWKTLAYAGATASTGIIHVLPGAYTETAPCILKTGVSIEGEGLSSHITFTYTGECIQLKSNTDGTNGNQHISGLWIDGSNRKAGTGIQITARSNVKIYDCTVENFLLNGVRFYGTAGYGKPSVYMTGCEVYNCKLKNNSNRTVEGQGSLVATGYKGILIHDNIFDQTGYPAGTCGNTYSATAQGYSEGFKFYNNKSYRLPYDGPDSQLGWGFHLEMWNSQGGQEVYNNEFYGGLQGIDWAGEENGPGILPGIYGYAAYVHDNLFQLNTQHSIRPNAPTSVIGVNIEGNVDGIIIENNHFKNYPYPVQMTLINTTTYIKNITIKNNLFENTGYSADSYTFDIGILTSNCPDAAHCKNITNINIFNNTFKSPNADCAIFIYGNPTASKANNVQIINNIVWGSTDGWLKFQDVGVQSTYTVKNNLLYQNGNNNNVVLSGGASLPTSWVYTGNFVANPLLDVSFKLTASSPAINAGVNVGLPYNGSAPDIGAFETGGIVTPPVNQPPVANAGQNQTITLPVNSATLSGSGTDADGVVVFYLWEQISGPTTSAIANTTAATTTVNGLAEGTYQFQLTVIDNLGAKAMSTMQTIVKAAVVSTPTVTNIDFINTSVTVQKTAIITWGAASGSNTRKFEVQRKSRYSTTYSTVSGGTFTAIVGYKEYSKTVNLNTGINYFRIKVSYTDRTPTYSNIFSITKP